jgi:hypothetical protein
MRDVRLIPTMKAGEFVIRLTGATELDRLVERSDITKEQYDAGVYLAADRYASGLSGRGSSWHSAGRSVWRGSYFEQMDETMEAAWRRYTYAMHGMPRACAREVLAVVIDNLPCRNLSILREGLSALATYYARNPR